MTVHKDTKPQTQNWGTRIKGWVLRRLGCTCSRSEFTIPAHLAADLETRRYEQIDVTNMDSSAGREAILLSAAGQVH